MPAGSGSVRERPGALYAALGAEPDAVAFAPYTWDLAVERAGMNARDMAASASRAVAALDDVRTLLGTDAIYVVLDQAAEQQGATEVLRRLSVTRSGWDLVAVVPGPSRMAAGGGFVDAEEAAEASEDCARSALEAGCNVLAVAESHGGDKTMDASLRTIARLSGFYGARTLVIGPGCTDDEAAHLVEMGFDAVDAGRVIPTARVTTGPVTEMSLPDVKVVTSSWKPSVGEDDVPWLMERSRQCRQTRTNAQ